MQEEKNIVGFVFFVSYSSLQHIVIISVNAQLVLLHIIVLRLSKANIILGLPMLQIKINRATPWEFL